ncbi:MAG: amidohydrolase [Clostridia bacterium]|nr:amidohydrolase [Clostridia bacterium]
MKILMKNAKLLKEAGYGEDPLYLVITEDKISYIGKEAPAQDEFDRTIDCRENLVIPAFYNAHCHAAMTLFRGYGEDLPLKRWLNERILPAEDKLNFRSTYFGSKLAIAEMIRNGIISFSDMYMFEDATAEAVLETGVKANLARSIVSFEDGIKKEEDARFAEAVRLVEQYHGAGDGRLKIDMSLHAEYTNVDATCRYVAEYAKEHGLLMQLHASETEAEHLQCMERRDGRTPIAYLNDMGVLDVPTSAAHCVYVTDEDIAIMREKNVTAVHNPVSNLKLGSGIMPIDRLASAGVRIALGTDGAASNNTLDILKEMQLAAILHKGISRDPAITTAAQMPPMATRNGALAQGREDCGLIAVDAKADLVMIDMNAINNIPSYGAAETLCYSANSSNVILTMCDGRILYENGAYTSIDIECLKFEARQVIRRYFD